MKLAAQLATLIALTSCGTAATEIVISVDTDIEAAVELRVDATYPRGRTESATADLAVRPAPRTLVFLHQGGPLGPLRLRIAARGPSGEELVMVEREVAFEAGVSLTLGVFLSGACEAAMCPPSRTCGDDGTCRAIAVDPCEYEGRICEPDAGTDSGTQDAGPEDDAAGDAGTGCSSLMVCGVARTHLPGDLVTPRICSMSTSPAIGTITGPSGDVPGSGTPTSYLLTEPGDYTVDLVNPFMACFHSLSFRVAGPTLIDDAGATTGALRDLGARTGSAFVAGAGGAWAVDDAGWHDLIAGADGTVAPIDLQAAVVIDDLPFFGPSFDDDAVYRVAAIAPFSTVTHTRIALPAGNRRVRAMGARVGGLGPLAIATQDDIVLVDDPTAGATARTLGPSYDAQAWIAIGEAGPTNLGAIWGGRSNEVVNRSTSGGGVLFMGSPVPTTPILDDVSGAVAHGRGAANANLWLCGMASTALYEFPVGRDWPGTTALPATSARWLGDCRDIAIDVDGDPWLASGTAGLVRLAPDGSERLVYGSEQGLPAGTSVDFVAVAANATTREVWILDGIARRVVRYRADLLR